MAATTWSASRVAPSSVVSRTRAGPPLDASRRASARGSSPPVRRRPAPARGRASPDPRGARGRAAGGARPARAGSGPRPGPRRDRGRPRSSPHAAASSTHALNSSTWYAWSATVKPPLSSRSQSIPCSRVNATSARRLAIPSCSRNRTSSGKWRIPFARPWVRDAWQNPPFRPLAPNPTVSCSRTVTRSEGSVSVSARAVHNPVNPAPTTATSVTPSPRSGGRSGPAGDAASQ